jgi:hypothetical protein
LEVLLKISNILAFIHVLIFIIYTDVHHVNCRWAKCYDCYQVHMEIFQDCIVCQIKWQWKALNALLEQNHFVIAWCFLVFKVTSLAQVLFFMGNPLYCEAIPAASPLPFWEHIMHMKVKIFHYIFIKIPFMISHSIMLHVHKVVCMHKK